MRKVAIVEAPGVQRCWLARDASSGETLLRLHDRGLLERICRSLEWKVMETRSSGEMIAQFHVTDFERWRSRRGVVEPRTTAGLIAAAVLFGALI